MTSLLANKLDNDRDFFKFFKTIILPRAIGSVYRLNQNGGSHDIYGIGYNNTGSGISQHRHDIVIPINQSMGRTCVILDIPRAHFFNILPINPQMSITLLLLIIIRHDMTVCDSKTRSVLKFLSIMIVE